MSRHPRVQGLHWLEASATKDVLRGVCNALGPRVLRSRNASGPEGHGGWGLEGNPLSSFPLPDLHALPHDLADVSFQPVALAVNLFRQQVQLRAGVEGALV